jgi:hypothetical protein
LRHGSLGMSPRTRDQHNVDAAGTVLTAVSGAVRDTGGPAGFMPAG